MSGNSSDLHIIQNWYRFWTIRYQLIALNKRCWIGLAWCRDSLRNTMLTLYQKSLSRCDCLHDMVQIHNVERYGILTIKATILIEEELSSKLRFLTICGTRDAGTELWLLRSADGWGDQFTARAPCEGAAPKKNLNNGNNQRSIISAGLANTRSLLNKQAIIKWLNYF